MWYKLVSYLIDIVGGSIMAFAVYCLAYYGGGVSQDSAYVIGVLTGMIYIAGPRPKM